MVPWKEDKPLAWDNVLIVSWKTRRYVDASASDVGYRRRVLRKVDKYSTLERTHFLQPIADESLGPMNTTA